MKILWYADFEGDDKQLAEMNRLFDEVVSEVGATYEGPFYPQENDLLYIMDVPGYDSLHASGRRFLPRAQEAGIPVIPQRYEIAVTPEEFWGERA